MVKRYSDVLALNLVAGQGGLGNIMLTSDVHRPGLALAGFLGLFTFDRVQVLGTYVLLKTLKSQVSGSVPLNMVRLPSWFRQSPMAVHASSVSNVRSGATTPSGSVHVA